MTDALHILQPIEAKLLPPPLSNIVLRDETRRGYEVALERKLTLVSAPIGYGKSSATAAILERAHLPTAWYSIDDLDHEEGVLLAGITHAIRTLLPNFGEDLLELFANSTKAPLSAPQLAAAFARSFANLEPQSIHLVLDDYHLIADSRDLNQLLNLLLRYTPPSLHFVVLSRRTPRLDIIGLELTEQVGSIGPDLLRLELAQTDEIMRLRDGRPWGNDDLKRLLTLTGGWPAGIVLAGTTGERHAPEEQANPERSYLFPRLKHSSLLSLAQQAYHDEEEELRQILLRCCLLTTLTADHVHHLMSPTRPDERLRQLAAGSVFLLPNQGQKTYRFNPLFREFLKQKYIDRFGRSSFRVLHLRSAELLESSGELAGAVDLLLEIDEPLRALEALTRATTETLDEYPLSLLYSWLNRLPTKLQLEHPMGLVLCAQSLARRGNAEAALRKASEAARLAGTTESLEFIHAIAVKERICACSGVEQRSLSVYGDALRVAREDEMRARVLIDVGLAALRTGSRRDASESFGKAESFLSGAETRESTRLALARCFMTYIRGEFKAARLQSTSISGEGTITDIRLCPHSLRGAIEAGLGNLASARDLLQHAAEKAAQQGDSVRHHFAYNTLAMCMASSGRIAEGFRAIETIRAMATSHLNPSLIALVFNTLGTIIRRQGDPREAIVCHRAALNAAVRGQNPYAVLESRVNLSFSESLERGDCASDLTTLAGQAATSGLQFLSLKAQLLHAMLLHASGETAACVAALADCVPRQLELGHISLLTEELALAVPSLASYLAREETSETHANELLSCIAQHWRGPATLAELLCTPHLPLAQRVLSLTREQLPPEGQIEILRAGRTSVNETIRRRSKVYLSAVESMLSDPNAPLPELTRKEYHVLSLIADGLSNQIISSELIISMATIKSHINRIFMKLDITTRVQAILAYQAAEAKANPEDPSTTGLSTLIQPTV